MCCVVVVPGELEQFGKLFPVVLLVVVMPALNAPHHQRHERTKTGDRCEAG